MRSAMSRDQDEYQDDELEVIPPEPLLPDTSVPKLGENTTLSEIIEDDANHHQLILSMLKTGWKHVTNLDELCKMALTHTKVLEMRRKHLLKPVEAPRDTNNGNGRLGVWDA